MMQAHPVGRSHLMARPMSRGEWVVALSRGPDYEGGWRRYLLRGHLHGR